jgi:hypothetical protein
MLTFLTGLPDDIFLNPKSQFRYIFEGHTMEDVDTFYGHLVYFTSIWYILWPFDTFYVNLKYFSLLGMLYQK